MCNKRNMETLSRNNCCRRKAMIITYSECVFLALGVHHAKRLRLIILPNGIRLLCHIFPLIS
jgi:hypothetical protein